MNTRANRKVQSEIPNVTGRHAVVLGGSLAGLLAARILADHFDRVTLLERDAYRETSEVRKGVPQGNHVHGLLLRGRQVLEDRFCMKLDLVTEGKRHEDSNGNYR